MKYKREQYLFIIIVIFTLVNNIYAQKHTDIFELPDGTKYSKKKSEILTVFKKEDGKYKVDKVIDLNESKNIIVEFKEPPLCLKNSKHTLNKSNSYDEHQKFKNKLKDIVQSPNTLSKRSAFSLKYDISKEYYKVFNGLAMSCKRGLVNIIENMTMVKHVYNDITLKVDLSNSISQIKADIVQDSLGYTGKNVIVGILDSGIDYMHPALGGGFGPEYKVIGGYDFINDDEDPMDDRGHGTHVAGIVAAEGDSIVGVAPDAKLLAVKVMDANGEGNISDVIAGIEYCFDPDGNINTDDGADILNMSFSGYTESPNPLDSIVSYIDKAGILSVAAAGNRYDESTIGTPGTAQQALTVGACDKFFNKIYFSSEGPDPIHELLKPEIVAPGVNIRSTVLDGKYDEHSGTSMAAPHIAGVAALIKEKYPDIFPTDLKSIIVNNAQEMPDEKIYAVGNGCVNALRSIQDSLIINPGTISFGFADSRLSEWRDTSTIVIKNQYSESKYLQLTTTDISSEQIKINFSEKSFYLEPQEERKIIVEIIVPGSVPVKDVPPYTYSGKILCISKRDSTRIPFGFIKSSQLKVHFDKKPYLAAVINKTTEESYSLYDFNNKKITTRLPSGMYDFICVMTDSENSKRYIVGKKNLSVDKYNEYYITYKDAKYSLNQKIYDYNNNLIYFENNQKGSCHLVLGYKYTYGLWVEADYISPLNTNWTFSKTYRYDSTDFSINIVHEVQGIDSQSDLLIPSGSKNLVPYDFHYKFPNESKFQENSCGLWIRYSSGGSWTSFMGKTKQKKLYLNKTFSKKYQQNELSFQPMIRQMVDTTLSYSNKNNFRYHYGPYMKINKNGVMNSHIKIYNILSNGLFNEEQREEPRNLVIHRYYPNNKIYFTPESEVKFPLQSEITINPSPNYYIPDYYKGPILKHGGFLQILSSSGISKDTKTGHDLKYFMKYNLYVSEKTYDSNNNKNVIPIYNGPYHRTSYPCPYTIYSFFPELDSAFFNKKYKIAGFSPIYKIQGQKGVSVVENIFKYNEDRETSQQQIIDIPVLQLFQIISSGEIVTSLQSGNDNYVHFKLYDRKNNIDEVRTVLITNNGQKIPLFTEELANGTEFKAQIPSDLPNEFIDVEIFVNDSSNSSTLFLASPGFYFGNSEDISYESRVHLIKYELKNSKDIDYSSGDLLRYSLIYKNIGNVTAEEVYLELPETKLFEPENKVINLNRILSAGDSCTFDIILKLNKDINENTNISYQPKIRWKNDEKQYMRKHSIFNSPMSSDYLSNAPVSYKYKLYKNYPNPFDNRTNIKFALLEKNKVKISIYDIRGRLVKTLTNKIYSKGFHSIYWNGKNKYGNNVSSGIYFYRMTTNEGYAKSFKMILMK